MSMKRHGWWGLLAAVAALTGCPSEVVDPEPTQADHPCDAVWGAVPAAGRLYVDPAASSGGDGSLAAPFDTLDAALAESRVSGALSIAIASGDLSGTWVLGEDDTGLEIAGCGRQSTLIEGVEAEQGPNGELVLQPAFDVRDPGTANITIRDLGVVAARRALLVQRGAGALGPITVARVDVLQAVRVGVLIDGGSTVAHLDDVVVEDVATDGGDFGWGIAVQTGRQLASEFAGPTVLTNVEVRDVTGLGILADGAFLEVTDSLVTGVLPTASGLLGRGVQMQQFSQGCLDGLEATGNSDAAVFLESPGRAIYDVDGGGDPVVVSVTPIELLDSTLGSTSAVTLPGGEDTGDGLVATHWSPGTPQTAEEFQVVIDGTEIAGNPRSAMIAETVTASLGTNGIFSKGSGYPVVAQGGAIVEAIGGGPPPDAPVELGPGQELALDAVPIVLDDPDAP